MEDRAPPTPLLPKQQQQQQLPAPFEPVAAPDTPPLSSSYDDDGPRSLCSFCYENVTTIVCSSLVTLFVFNMCLYAYVFYHAHRQGHGF